MYSLSSKTNRGFYGHLAGVCFGSGTLRLRVTRTVAAVFVLVTAQLQIGVSSIGPDSPGVAPDISLPATAILTIKDNRPITVNGAVTTSGATILSGAAIQTPHQLTATVNLTKGGSVDVGPSTTLTLVFAQTNTLKVILGKGCVSLRGLNGINGEIDTPEGVAKTTDANTGGAVSLCYPPNATGMSETRTEQDEHHGLFSLGKTAALAIVGGRIGTAGGVAVRRGNNPGPSAPY
jgi:hypothetical protein